MSTLVEQIQPTLRNLVEYAEECIDLAVQYTPEEGEALLAEWEELSEEEREDQCSDFTDEAIEAINNSGQYVAIEESDLLSVYDTEGGFDHNAQPTENGEHPEYPGLVLFEVEQHFGSLILTSPAKEGNALISHEDWEHWVDDIIKLDGDEWDFAYLSDEYLDLLTTGE